ncbi:MAG: Wzz/FepE/Etk N-terminal domain-containing protein [Flavobacteriaceae bacterium]
MKSQDETNTNNDEINLVDLFLILFKSKYIIIVVTSIFALFSILYSLSIPNKYTSSATLSIIEDKNSSGKSLLSGFSSIASIAGINLSSQNSVDKTSLVISTINSRIFFKNLLKSKDILPNILAAIDFDNIGKLIIYNEEIYDPVKKNWKSFGHKNKPSYLDGYKAYRNLVNIEQDKNSNIIYISVSHVSPIFSHDLLVTIIDELNNLTKLNDFKESTEALNYLNNQLEQPIPNNTKEAINELILIQIETQMLSDIRDEYIVRAIDPPFIPEEKSEPNRALICIIITLIGFFSAAFYSFIRHHYNYKYTEKNS